MNRHAVEQLVDTEYSRTGGTHRCAASANADADADAGADADAMSASASVNYIEYTAAEWSKCTADRETEPLKVLSGSYHPSIVRTSTWRSPGTAQPKTASFPSVYCLRRRSWDNWGREEATAASSEARVSSTMRDSRPPPPPAAAQGPNLSSLAKPSPDVAGKDKDKDGRQGSGCSSSEKSVVCGGRGGQQQQQPRKRRKRQEPGVEHRSSPQNEQAANGTRSRGQESRTSPVGRAGSPRKRNVAAQG